MGSRNTSVTRAVLVFALSGIFVLVLVGVAGVLLLRHVGTDEATREAENLAVVAGRGVVQPRLTDGILDRGARSLASIDAVVQAAVLHDPIVRVRLWTPDGQVVYSGDAPELIGSTFTLSDAARDAAATGKVTSDFSDESLAQNETSGPSERLLDVAVPVRTPDGHPLLFEASLRFAAVQASALELWKTFLPVLAVALAAFAALEIPLAYRLARKVRESQVERERLLQRAMDASELERRRITRDLHDGLVQEFAGLSMHLSATAESLDGSDPEAAAAVEEAATAMRQGMRSLRSAVMGIYPPTVQQAGLPAALSDLVAPLEAQGVGVKLSVPNGASLRPDTEALIFRCAQESVRNILAHAGAEQVDVAVGLDDGTVRMTIVDDGSGFSAADREEAVSEGHMGLRLLEDLARDSGGSFRVASAPGEGTRVELELPR